MTKNSNSENNLLEICVQIRYNIHTVMKAFIK